MWGNKTRVRSTILHCETCNAHLCMDCFTRFHTIEETQQLQQQFPQCVDPSATTVCGYCQLMMGNGPIATMDGRAGLVKIPFTSHTIDNCNGIKGNAISHVWHTTT